MNPTHALILLALAAILLAAGLRGMRVDRDPRCRARRCRYPLRELLDARRSANEAEWPLICPECGRVMESERRARRGARRRIGALVAMGIVLALPPLGLLGLEGYARWQSANAIGSMPLWLLLRQAEKDSEANHWVHQKELLDRVVSGAIDAADAPRVIDRILRWQADPSVDYGYAGDALVEFAERGRLTLEQQNKAWSQQHHFQLFLPDSVEPGAPLPVSIRMHTRSGVRAGLPTIDPHPWSQRRSFGGGTLGDVRIIAMRIDGHGVELTPERARLQGLLHSPTREFRMARFGWRPVAQGWDAPLAPQGGPGARVSVEIDLEWDMSGSNMFGLQQDPLQEMRWVSGDEWFAHRGVPTTGRATVSAVTRLSVRSGIVHEGSNDPAVERWIRETLAGCVISVQAVGEEWSSVTVVSDQVYARDRPATPADPPALFGRLDLVRGDWRAPIASLAHDGDDNPIGFGRVPADLNTVLSRAIVMQPGGWAIEFTPEPELATQTVERPRAWAGPPIRVPIGCLLRERCVNGEVMTVRFNPEGTPYATD